MRKILAVLAAVAASFCFAQDSAPPVAPTKDYSAGLAKILTLGLPDLSGASLVQLSWSPAGVPLLRPQSPVGFYGLAWLLEDKEDGPSRLFLLDGLCEVSLRKIEKKALLTPPTDEEKADVLRAFWTEKNVDKDAKRVLREFRKHVKQVEKNDGEARGLPAMLLWAAMLHGTGNTEAANEVAAIVFENSPDRRALLADTISLIADGKYNGVMIRFRDSADWQAYSDDLGELLAGNSNGWKRAASALELKQRLEKATGNLPPVLPASGSFSDTQRKAARVLLDASDVSEQRNFQEPWLLGPPQSLRYGRKQRSPAIQFMALQTDALPIIAAWLEDDTMTPLLTMSSGGTLDGLDMAEMFSQIEDEEQAMAMIRAMGGDGRKVNMQVPGPQTRAELARLLCRGILPAYMGDEYGDAKQVNAESFSEFVTLVKGKKGIDLARFYFDEGTTSQRRQAVGFLLAKGTEQDVEKVEQYILNTDEEYQRSAMLVQYLVNRGKDGLEFTDKIMPTLEQDYMKEQIDRTKKMLGLGAAGTPVEEKTFDEELVTFLTPQREEDGADSGEFPEDAESLQKLQMAFLKLSAGERMKALEKVAEHLAEMTDLKKAMYLMHLFAYARLRDPSGGYSRGGVESMKAITWEEFLAEAESEETDGQRVRNAAFDPDWDTTAALASIRTQKAVWLKILARKDLEAAGSIYGDGFGSAAQAAMALHRLVATDMDMMGYDRVTQLYALPDRGESFWIRSATAIIEGKTDEGLPRPSADDVSTERKAELTTALREKESSELVTFIAGFTAAEYLAFLEIIAENEDENIARKLTRLATTITHVECNIDDQELAEKMKGLDGKSVSTPVAKICLEAVKEQVRKKVAIKAVITFSPQGAKVKISSETAAMNQYRDYGMSAKNTPGGVLINARCDSDNAYVMVPLKSLESDKPEEATAKDADEDLDEDIGMDMGFWGDEGSDEQEVWDLLDAIEKGELNPLTGHSVIQFMGLVPAKKTGDATDDE